jgi:hypothetical protein
VGRGGNVEGRVSNTANNNTRRETMSKTIKASRITVGGKPAVRFFAKAENQAQADALKAGGFALEIGIANGYEKVTTTIEDTAAAQATLKEAMAK